MEYVLKKDKYAYQSCIDHVNNTNVVRKLLNLIFKLQPRKMVENNGNILTVNVTTSCPIPFAEEACSTDGRTFPSFCNLIKSKSRLAYKGPCLKYCNYHTKEKVCGINGVTYKSECDAWSGMSIFNYYLFHLILLINFRLCFG